MIRNGIIQYLLFSIAILWYVGQGLAADTAYSSSDLLACEVKSYAIADSIVVLPPVGDVVYFSLYDRYWKPLYQCDKDCEERIVVTNLPNALYHAELQVYDNNWTLQCQWTQTFQIDNGCLDRDRDGICAALDCDDFNPVVPSKPGRPCEDGNPLTFNDHIQEDGCSCEGETRVACHYELDIIPGGFLCRSDQVEIADVKIFDEDWQLLVQELWSGSGYEITSLERGKYHVKIKGLDENWSVTCLHECAVTIHESIRNEYSSEDLSDSDTGASKRPFLHDLDNNKEGEDTFQDDYIPPCLAEVHSGKDYIDIVGLEAPHSVVMITDPVWNVVFECGDDCQSEYRINDLGSGTYQIDIQLYTQDWKEICAKTEKVVLESGCQDLDRDGYCAAEDCNDLDAAVPAAPGLPCDDGNPRTVGDVIQEDGCHCSGRVKVECGLSYYLEGGIFTLYQFSAPYKSLSIVNHHGTTVWSCADQCPSEPQIELVEGNYVVNLEMYDEVYNVICSQQWPLEVEGVPLTTTTD